MPPVLFLRGAGNRRLRRDFRRDGSQPSAFPVRSVGRHPLMAPPPRAERDASSKRDRLRSDQGIAPYSVGGMRSGGRLRAVPTVGSLRRRKHFARIPIHRHS